MNFAMEISDKVFFMDDGMITDEGEPDNVNFMAKRLEIKEKGGITFIDDSYNASPESMSSALRVLSQISKGRMVAVLGDMNELGKDSEDFHKRIGRLVFDLGIEELIAVGEKGRGYIEGFSEAAEIEGKKNDRRQQ